jgi:hypothetical protein
MEGSMPHRKIRPDTANLRPRHEPPSLEEAVLAAQCFGETMDEQSEIAALLMGLSEDEVRPVVAKLAPAPPRTGERLLEPGLPGKRPVVVVERKARVPYRRA